MAIQSTLRCGCSRIITINSRPTHAPSKSRDTSHMLRKFFASHADVIPDNFEKSFDTVKAYFHSRFLSERNSLLFPYHFNDRISDLSKNTSPGIFFRKLGYKTKTDVLDDPKAYQRLRYYQHLIKTGKLRSANPLTYVCVASSKIDLQTVETKSRLVWVYPIEVCAIENMFYAPFGDYISDPDFQWINTVDNSHDSFCDPSGTSYSVDFKNFDASVPTWLILKAFEIVRSMLDFSYYQGGARPYSKSSLDLLWSFVVRYFTCTPFITPKCADVSFKRQGVPSGSMFTNLIDTICSRLILVYLHDERRCPALVKTYGDDCHVRRCTCGFNAVDEGASLFFRMSVKLIKPNEHGCLTYCKTECHRGQPFHPGTWYATILNCCEPRFRKLVAYCLLFSSPTFVQFCELGQLSEGFDASSYPKRVLNWKERFLEYFPPSKCTISPL